jgi:hypothetical protein
MKCTFKPNAESPSRSINRVNSSTQSCKRSFDQFYKDQQDFAEIKNHRVNKQVVEKEKQMQTLFKPRLFSKLNRSFDAQAESLDKSRTAGFEKSMVLYKDGGDKESRRKALEESYYGTANSHKPEINSLSQKMVELKGENRKKVDTLYKEMNRSPKSNMSVDSMEASQTN